MSEEINEHKRQVLLHLERVINEMIFPHFMDEAVVSLLVRIPGNPDANVLITSENATTRRDAVGAFRALMASPDKRAAVGEQP